MTKQKTIMLCLCLLAFLSINSQNKIYKAGEVYTDNIYQYGKMEVRMLAATGSGVISNFFTFKEGSELSTTFWEEIDIEVFGKDGANTWQSNLITGQGNTNLTRTEGIHQTVNLGQEYHTYTIEWKPNSVTWLVDGKVFREIIEGQSLLTANETSLRFNIWNPNIPQWVGAFDESILPVHMFVNWIKFYEWNGTSFSNTPSLDDNFDSFNENKWTKANHTFSENMSDFIPENVTTKDGYLVLSMTKENETGYTGIPPTDNTTIVIPDDPVAVITTNSTSGLVPLDITFDASDSYNLNNELLSFFWDFNDGNTSTLVSTSNSFANTGNYVVTLTVTNASGISNTTSTEITVNEEDEEPNEEPCNFNTPIENALTSINKSYTSVFVLGKNGPNLDNIANFTINWDSVNNGLWQLSFNTNNGSPNWWMDLNNYSSNSFSNSQPTITFNNTGISGLDGNYYANTIGDDFAMVSDTGDFSIYFSYSGTAPNCDFNTENFTTSRVVSIKPNPSNSNFTIHTNDTDEITIKVYETSGRLLNTLKKGDQNSFNFGHDFKSGVYYLKVYNYNELIKTSKIIKNK